MNVKEESEVTHFAMLECMITLEMRSRITNNLVGVLICLDRTLL